MTNKELPNEELNEIEFIQRMSMLLLEKSQLQMRLHELTFEYEISLERLDYIESKDRKELEIAGVKY